MPLHMIGLPIGEQKEMQNLGVRKSIKYNCPIMWLQALVALVAVF